MTTKPFHRGRRSTGAARLRRGWFGFLIMEEEYEYENGDLRWLKSSTKEVFSIASRSQPTQAESALIRHVRDSLKNDPAFIAEVLHAHNLPPVDTRDSSPSAGNLTDRLPGM